MNVLKLLWELFLAIVWIFSLMSGLVLIGVMVAASYKHGPTYESSLLFVLGLALFGLSLFLTKKLGR